MTSPIKIAYFGTPAYAEPALRALAADDRFDVRLVVTQPDRPAGRGHRLVSPRVKVVAGELGLPVYQPETLRDEESRRPLMDSALDVFVVAAYGSIFGPKTLAIPRLGCLNLHASILPAYRGAAPIPAAILRGDEETGVTLMEMEIGLDTGPIVDNARTPIADDDTTASLTERLATLGAALLREALPRWASGELVARPQPDGASAVRMLTKADGGIDWTRSAVEIDRLVRAMWPWPRARTLLGEQVVQIHRVSRLGVDSPGPGVVMMVGRDLVVGTGHGAISLDQIQLPGGRPVAGAVAMTRGWIPTGRSLRCAPPVEPPLVRPA